MGKKQKDFKDLTTKEKQLYKDTLNQVFEIQRLTGNSVKQQNTKIKNQVRSLLGQDSIRITEKSYNEQIDIDILKLRSAVKTSKQSNTPKLKVSVDLEDEQVSEKAKQIPETIYSKGELAVKKQLEGLRIRYKHEVTLDGLVSEYNREQKLPCDFVISVAHKLAMIEYNGAQHYQPTHNDVCSYSRQIQNDARRVNYSIATGIPLLVIHHNDKDKINGILNDFVHDVKIGQTKSKEYTNNTYAYFSGYIQDNSELYQSVFPSYEYPNIVPNKELGYLEINESQVIVWETEKLKSILSEIDRLKSENKKLTKENADLEEQLKRNTDILKETTSQLKTVKYKIDNEVQKTSNSISMIPKAVLTYNGRADNEMKEFIKECSKTMTGPQIHETLQNYGVKMSVKSIYKYMLPKKDRKHL